MFSRNKNTTWFANREPRAEEEGGRTEMTEQVVSERWKFWKDEKTGAGGKMAEAEKLMERESAADKEQQRLIREKKIM